MLETATVVLTKEITGGVAFRLQDGSHVLAEQIDSKKLRVGQKLQGQLDSMGIEQLMDLESNNVYGVFVQAYGLTLEAVRGELT